MVGFVIVFCLFPGLLYGGMVCCFCSFFFIYFGFDLDWTSIGGLLFGTFAGWVMVYVSLFYFIFCAIRYIETNMLKSGLVLVLWQAGLAKLIGLAGETNVQV